MAISKESTEWWLDNIEEAGGRGRYNHFEENLRVICSRITERGRFGDWIRSSSFGRVVLIDAVATVAAAGATVVATNGLSANPNPLFGGIPTASVVGLIIGGGQSNAAILAGV